MSATYEQKQCVEHTADCCAQAKPPVMTSSLTVSATEPEKLIQNCTTKPHKQKPTDTLAHRDDLRSPKAKTCHRPSQQAKQIRQLDTDRTSTNRCGTRGETRYQPVVATVPAQDMLTAHSFVQSVARVIRFPHSTEHVTHCKRMNKKPCARKKDDEHGNCAARSWNFSGDTHRTMTMGIKDRVHGWDIRSVAIWYGKRQPASTWENLVASSFNRAVITSIYLFVLTNHVPTMRQSESA